MGESPISSLTEREKDVLRALRRFRQVKPAANHLGLSVSTARTHLAAARKTLDVTSSQEAALILADAEGHPNETRQLCPIPDPSQKFDQGGATDGPRHSVRDSASSVFEPEVVPDTRDSLRRVREVLSDGTILAVAFAALVALIIFSLTRTPDAISNRTFEPQPAERSVAPE